MHLGSGFPDFATNDDVVDNHDGDFDDDYNGDDDGIHLINDDLRRKIDILSRPRPPQFTLVDLEIIVSFTFSETFSSVGMCFSGRSFLPQV